MHPSIILKQSESMYDSYPFEESVKKEVQLVSIVDDTVHEVPKLIQTDLDVFYC